jgi:hypothetical protein
VQRAVVPVAHDAADAQLILAKILQWTVLWITDSENAASLMIVVVVAAADGEDSFGELDPIVSAGYQF